MNGVFFCAATEKIEIFLNETKKKGLLEDSFQSGRLQPNSCEVHTKRNNCIHSFTLDGILRSFIFTGHIATIIVAMSTAIFQCFPS